MLLPAGARLGPYEIVALLGKGGMGEVYRARDPRLGRDVAIKVLPELAPNDADRLRRFEQEARAVAALSHPHVLAVYDVGGGERPFLVTELLEGETLRARLGRGPLPFRTAIEFAEQMASGLAAAHDRGIVHRDLKPENLFLTSGDVVKILDFGLAKVAPAFDADATVARPSQDGWLVGTIGYMSPEQVRGDAADHRADIFALGAILHEMVSGRRAFQGDSPADTMSAILREDPPSLLRSMSAPPPTALAQIVGRCLAKDPRERFQSAREVGPRWIVAERRRRHRTRSPSRCFPSPT